VVPSSENRTEKAQGKNDTTLMLTTQAMCDSKEFRSGTLTIP
jgi:hypothetical protein